MLLSIPLQFDLTLVGICVSGKAESVTEFLVIILCNFKTHSRVKGNGVTDVINRLMLSEYLLCQSIVFF